MGDLLSPKLPDLVARNLAQWAPVARSLEGELPTVDGVISTCQAWGEALAPFIGDAGRVVGQSLRDQERILLEGAQGTMLDVDQGTYPFVTSSNAVAGGACTGGGLGPAAISRVIGIAKAYATRVGEGPFPTELHDELGERIRTAGAEFGATTGRPRRCGWIDLPALRMAVRANGLTSIALTKLDVLTGLDEVCIGTHYRLRGEDHDEPPFDAYAEVEVVYERMPGWKEDITGCRSRKDLPAAANSYIERLETLLACPVSIVSVGPDREETFGETNPFV